MYIRHRKSLRARLLVVALSVAKGSFLYCEDIYSDGILHCRTRRRSIIMNPVMQREAPRENSTLNHVRCI